MQRRKHRGRGGGSTHKSLGAGREHSGRKDLLGPHLFNDCLREEGAAAGRAESKRHKATQGCQPANLLAPPQQHKQAPVHAARQAAARLPQPAHRYRGSRRHAYNGFGDTARASAPARGDCRLPGHAAHPRRISCVWERTPRVPRAFPAAPRRPGAGLIPGGFSLSVTFHPSIESLFSFFSLRPLTGRFVRGPHELPPDDVRRTAARVAVAGARGPCAAGRRGAVVCHRGRYGGGRGRGRRRGRRDRGVRTRGQEPLGALGAQRE